MTRRTSRRNIIRAFTALAFTVGIIGAHTLPVAAAPDGYTGTVTIDPGVDAAGGAAPMHIPGTAQSTAHGLDITDLVDGGDATVNDITADTSPAPLPPIPYFASGLDAGNH